MPFQLMPSPPQRTSVIKSTACQLGTPTQENVTIVEPAIPSDSGLSVVKSLFVSSEFKVASLSNDHTSPPSTSTAVRDNEANSPLKPTLSLEERSCDITDEKQMDGIWTQELPINVFRPVPELPPISVIEKESAFPLSSVPPSTVTALEQNANQSFPFINVSPMNGVAAMQTKTNNHETVSIKCDEPSPESLSIFSNPIFNAKEKSNISSTLGPSFITTSPEASVGSNSTIGNPVVTTTDTGIATIDSAVTTGSPVETAKPARKTVVEDKTEDHEREEAYLYYKNVCSAAASVVSNIQIWKAESESMVEADIGFEEEEKPDVQIQPTPIKVEDSGSILPNKTENIDVIMPRKIESIEVVNEVVRNENLLPNKEEDMSEMNPVSNEIRETRPIANEIETPVDQDHGINSFSNSLDILAMVASGFFGAAMNTNEHEVEDVKPVQIPETAPQLLSVASLSLPPPSLADPISSSRSFAAPSFVDSDIGVADNGVVEEYPVSSYLCDGTLLQLNYSRHPDNVSLFRKVWKKGFVSISVVQVSYRYFLWL